MELDQSSELYKTIVAAIIKEEDDGDIEDDNGDIEEDAFAELEEKAPTRDAGAKIESQSAGGRVIKRFVNGVHRMLASYQYQDNWCWCWRG